MISRVIKLYLNYILNVICEWCLQNILLRCYLIRRLIFCTRKDSLPVLNFPSTMPIPKPNFLTIRSLHNDNSRQDCPPTSPPLISTWLNPIRYKDSWTHFLLLCRQPQLRRDSLNVPCLIMTRIFFLILIIYPKTPLIPSTKSYTRITWIFIKTHN